MSGTGREVLHAGGNLDFSAFGLPQARGASAGPVQRGSRLHRVRFGLGVAALVAALVTVMGASAAWGASTTPFYQGDFPDPFVTRAPDAYYAYSTQVGSLNVPVTRSVDLATWGPLSDALPRLPSWAARGHTWAPAVARRGSTWVMWYTTRHAARGIQCISVATASSPAGPFRDRSTKPFICQRDQAGSIDPSPFVAADGNLYLHWKSDGNAVGKRTFIWAQQLSSNGLNRVGSEVVLLAHDAGTWEDPLVEGPSMALVGGKHYLFYGAGWWESDKAAIGYATCTSPMGGCTKRTPPAAWMAADRTKAGPAGPTLFSPDGGSSWRVAYHAWKPGKVGYRIGGHRAPWIDAVDFSSGSPVIR